MRWLFLMDGAVLNRDHVVKLGYGYSSIELGWSLYAVDSNDRSHVVSTHVTESCAEEALKDTCVGREHVCHMAV